MIYYTIPYYVRLHHTMVYCTIVLQPTILLHNMKYSIPGHPQGMRPARLLARLRGRHPDSGRTPTAGDTEIWILTIVATEYH